jgi:CRP-like cAMP-binding protein
VAATDYSNWLLAAMGEDAANELKAQGTLVDLPFGQAIYEAGDPVDFVYFPQGCLLSLVRSTQEGQTAESGLCGMEGALGLLEACGSSTMTSTTIVQVPGRTWRIPHDACRSVVMRGGRPTQALCANAEFLIVEARQSALCRSYHPIQARLARWILEYHERAAVDRVMPVTQELLAAMLAVTRTTVTATAGELKARKLIDYNRGKLVILNKPALEALVCECRPTLHRERERVRRLVASA